MFMNRESLARCLVGVATPQREQYKHNQEMSEKDRKIHEN